LDVIASLSGLVVLSPIFLCVATAIAWASPGPVFHRALRVGRDGRLFRLYKFRSMVVAPDAKGPGITSSNDPRITGIGRVLRASKLDELPQLINVLKGEMSLVGPRPEDPRYVAHYSEEQRRVLRVRPGITSAASLEYRRESLLLSAEDSEQRYLGEILPHKLAIDLEYLDRRTVGTDMRLIWRTVITLFSAGAAELDKEAGDNDGNRATWRT